MASVQTPSMKFATAIVGHLKAASYIELSALALAVIFLISYATSSETPKPVGAAFAPKKWKFEPSAIQRLRFTTQARYVLQEAYDKYKDRIFIMPRVDRDITVMPFKYLDEMRSMARSVMNATNPQALNLCAQYTYVDFLFHTDILLRSVNKKLTPDLKKYVNWAKEEMDDAFHSSMPQPDNWIELDIQDKVHEVISRMSARVFLGQAVAQNEEWIHICVQFTNDLFGTGFILKHFPEWLRPVVAPFIPSRWRLRQCVDKGGEIVGSQIKTRQDAITNNMPPEDTLLGWMLDNGTDADRELTRMTQLQLLLMLAGIHTTTMAVANFLFDLCTHPEWTPILRKEIEDVIAEYGPVGSRPDISAKVWLTKLEKMDSFLIESQRFEPSTQLKPARVMLQDVTLKDGTHLPRGTMIAWAGHQHVHDPTVNPDPHVFDPLRSYRKRYANDKAEYNKYIAGQNESTSLAFGYGNQACPGRYFAVNEIKLMLSRLLVEYEWKLPDGTTRPRSFDIEENVILQPHCKIMMRSSKV